MAHFAEIDENNIVLRIVVVDNNDLLDDDGVEQESLGVAFCQSLFGGTWKQTSYNQNFRKNYAGINFTYDATRNAFIPPKPFASWVLNETTCLWEAPTANPNDGQKYSWNEETLSWDLIDD
jgi:hypothetical protein